MCCGFFSSFLHPQLHSASCLIVWRRDIQLNAFSYHEWMGRCAATFCTISGEYIPHFKRTQMVFNYNPFARQRRQSAKSAYFTVRLRVALWRRFVSILSQSDVNPFITHSTSFFCSTVSMRSIETK